MNIDFVKYDIIFLEKSREWLQDKELKYLTMTPDYSLDEQKRWFNGLKVRKDYMIWGLMYDNKPIGACGLKHITSFSGEYWGYIGEKNYWGQKIGEEMVRFIERKAAELHLREVYLQVLAENIRAVRLYERLGYRQQNDYTPLLHMKKSL